jgi:hypothetical protein
MASTDGGQTMMTEYSDAGAVLPSAVRNYVAEIVATCGKRGEVVSVIVFGSSASRRAGELEGVSNCVEV